MQIPNVEFEIYAKLNNETNFTSLDKSICVNISIILEVFVKE